MRLTLRTLLAYLDNILDPKDREVLSEKIQTSEFAQTLVQRMRTVLNDADISAAELMGRGLGQDPNSVADYLDNTMVPDQLEEFERQCLDSGTNANMQLAEVMSCHHVLAMILSEPAQFDASARERMYRLGSSTSAGNDAAVGGFSSESHSPQTESPLPQEPENDSGSIQESTAGVEVEEATAATYDSKVPDYLRGETSSRRFIPMAVTALVAACVTGAILIMLDRNDSEISPEDKQMVQKESEPTEVKSPDKKTADAGIADPNVQAAPGKNGPAPVADSSPTVDPGAEPSVTGQGEVDVDVSPKVVETDSEGAAENSENPKNNVAPVSGGNKTTDGDNKAEPKQTPDQSPAKPATEPVEQPLSDDSDNTGDNTGDNAGDAPLPQEAVPMGRLLSQDQILLATPDNFDSLRRVPPRDQLKSGQQLISLPTFRPEISLGLMAIEINGGTMMELLDMDEEDIPEIKMHCGQILIRPNVPNAQLRLRVDPQTTITFTLGETVAKMGLDVCRKRTNGRDPAEEPLVYFINVYALGGNVGWQTDKANGVIPPSERQSFLDSNPTSSQSPPSRPQWLDGIEITDLERRAQPRIEQMVIPDRSVKIRLAELAEEKRSEIKQLAMRCSAHIGYYDPLVESFGKKELYRSWDMYAEELHGTAVRSPQAAQRLRETLERLRGNDGFELYRMFWGYSDEGLQNNGEAAQLVGFLDHDELDYRVLSNWNLKRITGLGSQYRPLQSEQKRKKYAERWKKRLEKGEIKHKIEIPPTQN